MHTHLYRNVNYDMAVIVLDATHACCYYSMIEPVNVQYGHLWDLLSWLHYS